MIEVFFLTCLQYEVLAGRVNQHPQLSEKNKEELITELKLVTKKKCFAE